MQNTIFHSLLLLGISLFLFSFLLPEKQSSNLIVETGDVTIASHGTEVSILAEVNDEITLYVLQMSSSASPSINMELEGVNVSYSNDHLITGNYLFKLSSSSASKEGYTRVFEGFGLASGSDPNFSYPPGSGWMGAYKLSCKCFISNDLPDDCASGGEGATSCSHSEGGDNCSVSCASAFNACCHYSTN